MGKSKDMQWLPSGGVLVVAVGAALVAAILVNVYVGYMKSEYEKGSKEFLQLKEDVMLGQPLQERHLKAVPVPKPFVPALQRAIEAKLKESYVLGKKAPRDMKAGEFLWYYEFAPKSGERELVIPAGYVMVTIPINPENSPGPQLQPGSYANVVGEFDMSADPKRPDIQVKDVILNVRVAAIDGSTDPVEKGRSYHFIQILVRESQARQLLQIQKVLKSRHFTINLAHRPDSPQASGEAEISKDVLDIIEKTKVAPALLPEP
jgi:Flp pilus assembly protein CpaB